MPLIQRRVQPVYLSRSGLFDAETGECRVKEDELQAVTNVTLTNVLRQLANLVVIADEIFQDLAKDLRSIHDRSALLRTAVDKLQDRITAQDPTSVIVPEGDICTFNLRTTHFKSSQTITTGLFTATSRPKTIQRLYNAAVPTPVRTIRQLDQFRRDGSRSSKFFVCTPVLSSSRRKRWRKVDLDIETRKPLAVVDLRKWTSTEALGDITVQPDSTVHIDPKDNRTEDSIDHLLPSPEEQMMAIALRFPPSIVAVDVSGQAFARLSSTRRSLSNITSTQDPVSAVGRRRTRKRRDKRRNTIAGTSQREIERAVAGDETTTDVEPLEFEPLAPLRARSGGELFKLHTSPRENIKHHLTTLRQWSRTKLKAIKGQTSSSTDLCKPSFQSFNISDDFDDINLYEKVGPRRQASESRAEQQTNIAVKLRENSLQRRKLRTSKTTEPIHSSSGNWSASSESGRTSSVASETTSAHPRSSSTTATATTSSSLSLNQQGSGQSRRRWANGMVGVGGSGSEGTLTPDLQETADGETSSVYSCDTEGYYTSFHMDSGLKTLKEEDIGTSLSSLQLDVTPPTLPYTTFPSTTKPHVSNQLTAENEYELFGKGSTSTTTSSAGTVCTTLLVSHSQTNFPPPPPERKSSLERKRPNTLPPTLSSSQTLPPNSPDSGHNTSSSPEGCDQSAFSASPSPTSCDQSTTNSFHSPTPCDQSTRSTSPSPTGAEFREKTAIRSSRIPSMCAITPPISDDEIVVRRSPVVLANGVLETDLDEPRSYAAVKKHEEYVSLTGWDGSLERRRMGARVTLDGDGKVVYASDSLKRRKDPKTFEPGSNRIESPGVVEHRVVKAVRPIAPQSGRSPSPRAGKIIRPNRVISPTKTPDPVPVRRMTPDPVQVRNTPPTAEKDYQEDIWISKHPAVSASGYPRNHPMYWTLPSRPEFSSSTPTKTPKNTPNLTLSPIKSTMTSEELFAAIHKSKKKLIKEPEAVQEIKRPETGSKTSTQLHNFKMLLLQKGVTERGGKSAVEQLKQSKSNLPSHSSSKTGVQQLSPKNSHSNWSKSNSSKPLVQNWSHLPKHFGRKLWNIEEDVAAAPVPQRNLRSLPVKPNFPTPNGLRGSFIGRHFSSNPPAVVSPTLSSNESSLVKNVSLETAL